MLKLRSRTLTTAALAVSLTTAAPALADTKTWTGAVSNLWSVAGNWAGGVPLAGDLLVFPAGASNLNNTNDLAADTEFQSLTFNGSGYQLGGNAIELSGGVNTTGPATIDFDIRLTASQTFFHQSFFAPLTLNGSIDLQTFDLDFGGAIIQVPGAIAGTGQLSSHATVILDGVSTFSGQTLINSVLEINGVLDSSSIVVNASFGLLGTGVTGPVEVNSGRVSPGTLLGNPIGVLATQDLTFDITGFGSLDMHINGAVPGVSYDQLAATGAVTLTDAMLVLYFSPSFIPARGQTFLLIDNDGSDPITGILGGFTDGNNPMGGSTPPLAEGSTFHTPACDFSISYVGGTGNDLELTCENPPNSWTGAVSNLWSNAGNWSAGVPIAGDILVFPAGASNLSNTNDLAADTEFQSLTFNGSGYQLGGNAIGLSSGIHSSVPATIDFDIRLTASQTFSHQTFSGPLTLNGSIDLQTFDLDFGGAIIQVPGAIAGTGQLSSHATVILDGVSTFSGQTLINSVLEINGVLDSSSIVVNASFGLLGTGVTGPVEVNSGRVSPGTLLGNPIGVLATQDLTFDITGFGSLDMHINGAVPGVSYDQLAATGAVTLTDAMLVLYFSPSFIPARGQKLLLIDNDESDAITGIVGGVINGNNPMGGSTPPLAEGETFNIGPYPFEISYIGGDGNDLVITSLSGDPFNAAPESEDDEYGLDTSGSSMVAQNSRASLGSGSLSAFRQMRSEPTLSVGGRGVLLNDSDPDDDPLSVIQAPIHSVRGGTVSVTPGGSFVYEPRSGFLGADSFIYISDDANGGTGFAYARVFVHTCGDGNIESPIEECDDSNLVDGDGCDSNCTTTRCGNGITTAGEQCDEGPNGPGCCTPACEQVAFGTTCDDGDPCTEGEHCASGLCQGSTVTDCDDGDLCTVDTCDAALGCQSVAAPVAANICLAGGKVQFQLKNDGDPSRTQLRWKWLKGQGFDQAALGTPDVNTAYALCVYDTTASTPTIAASIDIAPGTLWTTKDPKGWGYTDKAGSSDGVQKLQLKTGATGKTKAQIKSGGINLPVPVAVGGSEYFDQDPTVVVQMISSSGMCLTSEFDSSRTLVNDGVQFKAKAP